MQKLTAKHTFFSTGKMLTTYFVCGTTLIFVSCVLNKLHGEYCGLQWDRPSTWLNTMMVSTSPGCRTLLNVSKMTQQLSEQYFFL